MGKKSKLVQKGKGEKKELQALSRRIKVNLHKQLHGVQFKKKAPCAVKVIKELVKRNYHQSYHLMKNKKMTFKKKIIRAHIIMIMKIIFNLNVK